MRVDLNSDLGESFGRYTLGMDSEIIPLITSANVACGFHASDPTVMHKTIEAAKAAGIRVGAHPGYPDLMGFGRRNMVVSDDRRTGCFSEGTGDEASACKAPWCILQYGGKGSCNVRGDL